jgi:peptide/nickel transport system substrate-binding protein
VSHDRAARLGAAAVVACLVLSACSRGGRDEEAARRTITVGLTGIGSLDPSEATSPAALTILRTACDPLIGQDPWTGDLEPALASEWRIAPGAGSLTVRLKPEARYHDGRRVLPSGVAAHLSRVAQTGGASPGARELASVLGQPGEQKAGTIRVTEDGALRVDLPQAYAELPVLLASPALAPVSDAAPEEGAGPACAGPYRITAVEGGLRLVREERYTTGNTAFEGRGAGYAGTIVVKEFPSVEEAYEALGAGTVDAAPVPESRVAEAEARGSGHARRGTPEITYLAFDTAQAPTSSPVFRRAVSLAVDRVALVDAAFGDRRPPATRWLVEGPDRPTPRACAEGARRVAEPARARDALVSAGVDPKAVRLPLLFDQERTSPLVVQAVEASLEENLGIGVRPEPLDVADFQAALAARAGPKAWMATTQGDIGVPEHVLEALFRTGAPGNTNGFSDPQVDELLDRARRATDAQERERAYAEAEDRACELMPYVPLWTGVSHWAFDPKKLTFTGPSPIDAYGGLLLREARPR